LFTSHLLNNLKTPELNVTEVIMRTGYDVSRAGNGSQYTEALYKYFETAYLGSKPAPGTIAEDGATKPLTSVSAFVKWLSSQPDNTDSSPYTVKLSLRSLEDIKYVLINAPQKYVRIDLSGSAITTIPDNTFYLRSPAGTGCDTLAGIIIPDGVTSIGESAFRYCTSLTSVAMPNTLTSIGKSAFRYCTSLTSVTIPNSITRIGENVFYYCRSLASVTIPNTVTSIGVCAFQNCTSLASVTIPDGVIRIENNAFSGCTNLAILSVGTGVNSIGNNVFSGCSSLTAINVVPANNVYTSENGVLYSKDKKNLFVYPAGKKETSFTMPVGVASIGKRAFYNCTSLDSVTIPNGVTSIGESAFANCKNFANVALPDIRDFADFTELQS
jgi:hypothetical protein